VSSAMREVMWCCWMSYVTCITTIDTIILTNYTNNAYYYDTNTHIHTHNRTTWGKERVKSAMREVYVYVYVCMYVCMYVCVYVYVYVCI
jgi:hypothetical protein